MDRKKPEPKIELPRGKSRDTRILMTWVEPAAKGARARVHVIVEEAYEIEGSTRIVKSARTRTIGRSLTGSAGEA